MASQSVSQSVSGKRTRLRGRKAHEKLRKAPVRESLQDHFPPPTPKSAVFTFGTWFRKKSPY